MIKFSSHSSSSWEPSYPRNLFWGGWTTHIYLPVLPVAGSHLVGRPQLAASSNRPPTKQMTLGRSWTASPSCPCATGWQALMELPCRRSGAVQWWVWLLSNLSSIASSITSLSWGVHLDIWCLLTHHSFSSSSARSSSCYHPQPHWLLGFGWFLMMQVFSGIWACWVSFGGSPRWSRSSTGCRAGWFFFILSLVILVEQDGHSSS